MKFANTTEMSSLCERSSQLLLIMKISFLALLAAATVAPLSAAPPTPPTPLVDAVAGTPAITNRHATPASMRVASNRQLGPSARL